MTLLAANSPTPSPGRLSLVPRLSPTLIHQVGARGWLESYLLAGAVLGLAALVLLGWTVAAVHRARTGQRWTHALPRWTANTGLGVVTSALLLVGSGIGINAYAGYIPNLGSVLGTHPVHPALASGRHPGAVALVSRVLVLRIGAVPALDEPPHTAYVYLPPGYGTPANAHRRYPVVYLIHGWPGSAVDWFRGGRVQRTMDLLIRDRLIGPMIVVSPDANARDWLLDSECLNIPGGTQIETYLAQVVPDVMDRTFRTIADRVGRAIGGMSSGGYCALNVGLHHLHRFSVILASEPYGDPGQNALRDALHGASARYRANSPDFYLPYWRFPVPVSVFLDAGGKDRSSLDEAWAVARMLTADGQDVGLRIAPDVPHSWYEARVELPYALIFAWQHLGHGVPGGSDAWDQAQLTAVYEYARTLPPLRSQPASPSPTPSATTPSPAATPTGTPSPRRSPTPSGRAASTSPSPRRSPVPSTSATPSPSRPGAR
jgi:S-formylglutathione hydrolase FrmB